jgi:hypothetical protein
MANNERKVAHFVGHDVADLRRRFPDVVINGAVDLKERIGCLSLSSHALQRPLCVQQQLRTTCQKMKPRSPRALLPLQSADGAASAAIGLPT